jgi:HK97 family phage major capsid protein
VSGLDTLSTMRKAELFVSDFSTNSGYLTVEQFREFIRIPVLKSVLLKLVRLQEMSNPTMEVSKITAMAQILHGATSGEALTLAQRSKPAVLPKVTLSSNLLRGAVPVPDEVLEDNIEREQLNNTIRDLIGEGIARDLENLLVNGDTTSSNDLLNVTNGIIKQIVSNVVAAGGVFLNKSVLRDIDLTLPDAFRTDTTTMRFMTSHKGAIWYRDSVSSRIGELGDKALMVGDKDPQSTYACYNGTPVLPIPLIPSTLGGGSNQTVVIYANPKLFIWGVQRNVKVEQQRDPASGTTIFHVSMRVDVKTEHEAMAVIGTGIATS